MRKLILSIMVSLDMLIEAGDGQFDWHHTDDGFDAYTDELLASAGALVYGRKAYESMAEYWPGAPDLPGQDPEQVEFARKMNAIPKIVFTSAQQVTPWNETVENGELRAAIARLKAEPGGDLVCFGGAELASALAREGLIDEYRLMVNPVALGGGKPLFGGLDRRLWLTLVSQRAFDNGLIQLTYVPRKD